MLHRMAGCIPILLYSSPREEDVKKLFHYLQSLCNGSGDLLSRKDAILCKNLQAVKIKTFVLNIFLLLSIFILNFSAYNNADICGKLHWAKQFQNNPIQDS
jgi:hypothetical protein